MGLDTTHDCWHRSYSSFHGWRKAVCLAAGLGDLDERDGFADAGVAGLPWTEDDPLIALLDHSDCEGQIDAEDCGPLADRLEALLPELTAEPWHQEATEQFIAGLRQAAVEGEDVIFK